MYFTFNGKKGSNLEPFRKKKKKENDSM